MNFDPTKRYGRRIDLIGNIESIPPEELALIKTVLDNDMVSVVPSEHRNKVGYFYTMGARDPEIGWEYPAKSNFIFP